MRTILIESRRSMKRLTEAEKLAALAALQGKASLQQVAQLAGVSPRTIRRLYIERDPSTIDGSEDHDISGFSPQTIDSPASRLDHQSSCEGNGGGVSAPAARQTPDNASPAVLERHRRQVGELQALARALTRQVRGQLKDAKAAQDAAGMADDPQDANKARATASRIAATAARATDTLSRVLERTIALERQAHGLGQDDGAPAPGGINALIVCPAKPSTEGFQTLLQGYRDGRGVILDHVPTGTVARRVELGHLLDAAGDRQQDDDL